MKILRFRGVKCVSDHSWRDAELGFEARSLGPREVSDFIRWLCQLRPSSSAVQNCSAGSGLGGAPRCLLITPILPPQLPTRGQISR